MHKAQAIVLVVTVVLSSAQRPRAVGTTVCRCMAKNPESFRRYVLRGVVIAVALLVLVFVLLALFVLSLPEGWNT